jgi:protein-S-isoprenylcysteine O-methyltransferase Ste14
MKSFFQKAAYLLTFAVILPLLLAWWTALLPLPLPILRTVPVAVLLLGIGFGFMGWATLTLWFEGGGLPMNAFPPPRWVAGGPFRLLAHPIYSGFTLACAGTALWAGSATGFWLTTPLVALGCTALVVGHEAPSQARRFGELHARPFLALPGMDDSLPKGSERAGSMLLVLGLWAIVYVGLQALGAPPDSIDSNLGAEASWPVWIWTEGVYASAYLAVPAAFLLAPDRPALRRLCIQGLAATALLGLLYLCLPFISPPRPFTGDGLLAALLRFEHRWTLSPAASFPSFHVVWAGLAAAAVSSRGRGWRIGAWLWALLLAASCITTGMHSSLDVLAGVALWPICTRIQAVWSRLLRLAERLSNSWRGWRIGPLRILNHALFPGLAGTVGFLGVTLLRGEATGVAVVAVGVLLGAGILAYWIEGSPELARPFGFYGGMLGALLAVTALAQTSWGGWSLVAALTVLAPLIQAVGRLRCLVQGCCHGARTTAPGTGIRIHEPHSRVAALAHLQGVPIHPTPLYSILGNLVIASLLFRLWSLRAPLAFITGTYLVLSGLARFMEEAYRGEPQTPILGGLHLYQWVATASVAAGMVVAAMPSPAAPPPSFAALGPWQLVGALLCGLAFAAAMGVDFPESGRRFARLSG